MAIDLEQVIEFIKENRNTYTGDQRNYTRDWLDAKGIDGVSLDTVMEGITELALRQVMGRMTTGGTPDQLQHELREVLGSGIELGYTIAELQLEAAWPVLDKEPELKQKDQDHNEDSDNEDN